MKIANALEGGLTGATTIAVLTDTLKRMNGHSTHLNLFDRKQLRKRFKKTGSKKPLQATKQYTRLAGDLLASTTFFGLSSLGKKKNTLLRGAALGMAAGLGSVLLTGDSKNSEQGNGKRLEDDALLTKVLEVSLYTIGGMIAGKVIDGKAKKKKNRSGLHQ